jgi:spore maturation protein CgeB
VFDVPACRCLLLTDHTRQLEDLMEPGLELLSYRSPNEIRGLVEQALKDKEMRLRIAAAGYRRVLAHHTYRHRMEEMVRWMQRDFGRADARPAAGVSVPVFFPQAKAVQEFA